MCQVSSSVCFPQIFAQILAVAGCHVLACYKLLLQLLLWVQHILCIDTLRGGRMGPKVGLSRVCGSLCHSDRFGPVAQLVSQGHGRLLHGFVFAAMCCDVVRFDAVHEGTCTWKSIP